MEFAVRELQDYPVSKVCRLLDIRLSAYYYRRKHPHEDKLPKETQDVITVFYEHFGSFGRRTIRKQLLAKGIRIGEHKITRIMKKEGLCSKYGRKKGKNVHTAPQVSEKCISENLFSGMSTEEKRDKVILSMDFTEQKVSDKKVYTCGIINICNKILESMLCGCKNNSEAACRAVEMAIKEYGVPYMILTDRGSPFVSKSFHDLLKRYGIRHSMSRPHTPGDNCFIETFWKSMKTEIGRVEHLTPEQYMAVIEFYSHYYNHERPHSTLGYCAPLRALRETVI